MKPKIGEQTLFRIWDKRDKKYISDSRKHYWASYPNAMDKVKQLVNGKQYGFNVSRQKRNVKDFEIHEFELVLKEVYNFNLE